MRLDSITAFLAVSNAWLGTSAGPMPAKRQDSSSIATLSSASTSASSTLTTSSSASTTAAADSSSSTKSQITQGLIPTTLSDGTVTTTAVRDPQATQSSNTTETGTATCTSDDVPVSTVFPVCRDANAKPFCLPHDESTLYIDKTYYTTWNSDFFPLNSTVQVKLQWANDSNIEAWSSESTPNRMGYVAVTMQKEWLQGFTLYDLNFRALNFVASDPTAKARVYDGPLITLTTAPPDHYKPSETTKFNKEGLMIGLPVSFAFVVIVVAGLWFGMRKNRSIGIGNIMGRRKGYGTGKSRRERLGLGKKGAIALQEREATRPVFTNGPVDRGHQRDDSLGSLVSEDGIRPLPAAGRPNQFREEIQRQRTGR